MVFQEFIFQEFHPRNIVVRQNVHGPFRIPQTLALLQKPSTWHEYSHLEKDSQQSQHITRIHLRWLPSLSTMLSRKTDGIPSPREGNHFSERWEPHLPKDGTAFPKDGKPFFRANGDRVTKMLPTCYQTVTKHPPVLVPKCYPNVSKVLSKSTGDATKM